MNKYQLVSCLRVNIFLFFNSSIQLSLNNKKIKIECFQGYCFTTPKKSDINHIFMLMNIVFLTNFEINIITS
jgi:hypothetical protein